MKVYKYQAVNAVQNIKNKYVIYAPRIKEFPFKCSINNYITYQHKYNAKAIIHTQI